MERGHGSDRPDPWLPRAGMGPASADATIHGPLRPSSESGTNL